MKGKYLILGSNVGDRETNIREAILNIEHKVGKVIRTSAMYQTEPWGYGDQPHFYNQVIEIETSLDASHTLKEILMIEKSMGRVRNQKWRERIIDIDILYFEDLVVHNKDLTLPHPGIPDRKFVLAPLCELIPDEIHPVLRISNAELLKNTGDRLSVEIVDPLQDPV